MNDIKLQISTGNSRHSIKWKPTQITWGELVRKLSEPIRTSETLEHFLSLKRSEQDAIKDVGGFVGGTLNGERRQNKTVVSRSTLTLDLDNIPDGETESVIEAVKKLGYAAAIYSTKKHRPEAPRLRIVMPLSAPVPKDEYEPIARKVAEYIGMSYCDPTTFEPARLMYWPTCCSDSDFVFRAFDAKLLDGANVLKAYGSNDEWKDASKWPVVPGLEKTLRNKMDKQADPLAKEGLIGMFCRSYTIQEAMDKFLPGLYEPTDNDENRYTYTGGSTTGGALVYDDKFLYSHHASDPCCNTLVNAFDLVRIHKFGDKDDDAKEGTPVNKLPSFIEMSNFVRSDDKIAAEIEQEKRDKLDALVATDVTPVRPIKDDDWQSRVTVDKRGDIENTLNNAYLIAKHDAALSGIAIDAFSGEMIIEGALPWDSNDKQREWNNFDDTGYRVYMSSRYKFKGEKMLDDALVMMAKDREYNSVADYINKLNWDGVKRIDTLFHDYLGADQNEYTKAVARMTLSAAVARALSSGEPIKFDYMPILVGPQGVGKSTFIAKLGGEWFTDSIVSFEGKDACEIIKGKWVCEVAELTAFNRSEISTIKQFLSKVDDRFRPAYARKANTFPRRCVFFGTSNDTEFLRDTTGNRRFLPIDIKYNPLKSVFTDLTQEVVDQIWAEAKCLYMLGEPLFLSRELEQVAKEVQEDHVEITGNEGVILRLAEMEVPRNWDKLTVYQKRSFFDSGKIDGQDVDADTLEPIRCLCAKEVWEVALGGYEGSYKRTQAMEINAVLKKLASTEQWEWGRTCMGKYGLQRGAIRVT